MELVMAARKTPESNFEGRFFDLLMDKLTQQDTKLDAIHDQTTKTNGRVTRLEAEVFGEVKKSELPPFYRDPKVLQIVGYFSLAFLILVAALAKFDIGGLIK